MEAATVAILSELDGVFLLKEEQRKAFLRGQHVSALHWLALAKVLLNTTVHHKLATCSVASLLAKSEKDFCGIVRRESPIENVQTLRERPKLELNPQPSCFSCLLFRNPLYGLFPTWTREINAPDLRNVSSWHTGWSKTYIKFKPKAKCKLTKSKIKKTSQKYRENGHKHLSGDQGA